MDNNQMNKYDVVIIGGGISGLSAAHYLKQEGLKIMLVEAEKRVGGRMKTDNIEGYLLDKGFQVLSTAYPECQKLLDYDALELRNFYPGAKIYHKHAFYQFTDPFKKPIDSLRKLNNSLSNFGDKLKIVALRNRTRRLSIEQLFEEDEKPTIDLLREWNFSDEIINSFFKPYLGGIFLEPDLLTSSRMFHFVFKMFGKGYAALPKNGMESIPKQLADRLNEDELLLGTVAKQIDDGRVILDNGEELSTSVVLVATDAHSAKKLIPSYNVDVTMNSVRCLYFTADEPLDKYAILYLNGNNEGWINNIVVPTSLQKTYAPKGKTLISVSVIKPCNLTDTELYIAVREELRTWFGENVVSQWIHLKTYSIENALPAQPTINYPKEKEIKPIEKGIFMCGDHVHDSSINGAIRSGRITADAISWHLALTVNQ